MPLSYKLILTLHIVAVISWMAGLLYLFRLFVYHAAEKENVVKERFKTMESRLFRFITRPAMVVAVVVGGLMLAMNPDLMLRPWLHAKLLFVFVLIGVTLYGGLLVDDFHKGAVSRSPKFFRIMNEVPTLLMILIVWLVIVRPF